MPWSQTHYHTKFGQPYKGRAMEGLVVCYVVWLRSMSYEMLGKAQGA